MDLDSFRKSRTGKFLAAASFTFAGFCFGYAFSDKLIEAGMFIYVLILVAVHAVGIC